MDGNMMKASHQWMTRPEDERFLSLMELRDHCQGQRDRAQAIVRASRAIEVQALDREELRVFAADAVPAFPTHWGFGQLSQLSGAPAGYLRSLPAPLAADCVNYGLRFNREIEEAGLLLDHRPDGVVELRCATGPQYGRVWNSEIAEALVERFGDGVTGQWRVPGEFKSPVEVTRQNTTFYAGDRGMFVFLADEERRITIDNRRGGEPGDLARGFFLWNSEVGSTSLGAAFFLFDEVCKNRIVWGMREYQEVRIRHTSGAPQRWLGEVAPVLENFSKASPQPIIEAIAEAKAKKLDDDLDKFLRERQFTRTQISAAKLAHQSEEGRPIETVWDAVTGITAFARSIKNQDDRVAVERRAGALLAA